jgi:hypothetical protein
LCASLARAPQAPVNAPRASGALALIAYVRRALQTLDIGRTQAEQRGKADSSAIRSGFALKVNRSADMDDQLFHLRLSLVVKTLIFSTS